MAQWSLYNSAANLIYEGLTVDEVRAIVSTIKKNSISDWYAWCSPWTEWQELTNVQELLEPLARPILAYSPPPPSKKSAIALVRQENENATDGSEEENYVDREHPRRKGHFTVTIREDQNMFETKTVDISEGGMLLARPLPDWVVGYCRVKVTRVNTGESIELTCAVVENQGPQARVRLQVVEDLAPSVRKRLTKLIAA